MEADCAELRALAQEARSLAQEPQGSARTSKAQKLAEKSLLLLLKLKGDARARAFEAEAAREETAKVKAQLEAAHLSLQNLQYERQHYEKEIRECQSYRSQYADSHIGLVPEEEFLQQAAPEILNRIGGNAHQLMLQRLTHELQQRKALVAKAEELKKSKAAARTEAERGRKKLDELQGQLVTLQDAARPLQVILAPQLGLHGMSRTAELLPLPLYILYSQMAAVREALGLPIKVHIQGSQLEAESIAKSLLSAAAGAAEGDAGTASAPGTAAAAGGDTGMAVSASAAQQQQQQGSSKSKRRRSASPADKTRDLYKPHPLVVVVEVQREAPGGRMATFICIRFQWLPALRLVTAHSESRDDNTLLATLFPGDDGSAAACAQYEWLSQLQGGAFKYDTTRPAKPYRWCQHLAGLDFAPTLPLAGGLTTLLGEQGAAAAHAAVHEGLEAYRRQQRVQRLVERLGVIKAGDDAIKKILLTLAMGAKGNPCLPPDIARYPRTPITTLVLWEEVRTAAATLASPAAAAAGSSGRGSLPPLAGGSARGGMAGSSASALARSALAAAVRESGGGAGGEREAARERGSSPALSTLSMAPSEAAARALAGLVGGRGSSQPPQQDGTTATPNTTITNPTNNNNNNTANTTALANGTATPAGGAAPMDTDAVQVAHGNGNGSAGVERQREEGEEAEEGEAVGVHEEGEAGGHDGDEQQQLLLQQQQEPEDDFLARFLAGTDDEASGPGGPGGVYGGAGEAPPRPHIKPVSRLYRAVLRYRSPSAAAGATGAAGGTSYSSSSTGLGLEVEVAVRIFLEYPTRPPLLLVKTVSEPAKDRRTPAKQIKDANLFHWLETEANMCALSAVPPAAAQSTLLYQLLHMRLALDEFAAMYVAEAGNGGGADSADALALLQAKQRLRGRDRHAALPVLMQ